MAFLSWSFFVFVGAALSADVFEGPAYSANDVCKPVPAGGVAWILHVRERNYGWGENTHRANIALAVNEWRGTDDEMTTMGLQLEDELLSALMSSSPIHETDLALYIHALIATQRNPRNFHGTDLVAHLLDRVKSTQDVHPFLVLALCNAHAVEFDHLMKIKKYTEPADNSTHSTWEIEMKALALKALACAADLTEARSKNLDKFSHAMESAAKCLIAHQVGGIWGANPYRTSLAVQALTAYGKETWEEQKSLDYLRRESGIDVNMIKTYYIEMALNCRRVKFIKDLYRGPYDPVVPVSVDKHYSTYTVKDEEDPDIYFSVIMKIPRAWNFFQIMERASALSNRFNFDYVINTKDEPVVYKMIEKANDAEKNMFWRICRQTNINHDPHTSNITTFPNSPKMFSPGDNEHVIMWYRSSPCPVG